jgi:hypothetical protein
MNNGCKANPDKCRATLNGAPPTKAPFLNKSTKASPNTTIDDWVMVLGLFYMRFKNLNVKR